MKTISSIVHRKSQPLANGHKPQDFDVFQLFQENLTRMLEWYRNQEGQGRELGHFVMMEICLQNVSKALQDARDGKEWKPPS